MSDTIGKPYWHIHHEVLLEFADEPIENRFAYIKDEKPQHEIKTRLRLLRPVQGELPEEVTDAWKALADSGKAWADAGKALDDAGKAWADALKAWADALKALDDVRKVWADARKAWADALARHSEEINALHKAECPDCPWDYEQKTIFPRTRFVESTP